MLQSMGSQRVGHDLVTKEQQQPLLRCSPVLAGHRAVPVCGQELGTLGLDAAPASMSQWSKESV